MTSLHRNVSLLNVNATQVREDDTRVSVTGYLGNQFAEKVLYMQNIDNK